MSLVRGINSLSENYAYQIGYVLSILIYKFIHKKLFLDKIDKWDEQREKGTFPGRI